MPPKNPKLSNYSRKRKRSRTTWPEDKKEWLKKKLANFDVARKKDTCSAFWPPVYEEYEAKWPIEPPTADEIAEHEGDTEAAAAAKQDAIHGRIYWWIYNNSRGSSRGKRAKKSLKLSKIRGKLQAYQAYMKLYKSKVRREASERYAKYLDTLEEGESAQHEWAFTHTVAKDMLQNETDDVKEKVNTYRNSGADETFTEEALTGKNVEKAKKLQEAIDSLPQTLVDVLGSIERQTGWKALIICGGPSPRFGSLRTLTYTTGHTSKLKHTYPQYLGDLWTEVSSRKYKAWLEKVFPGWQAGSIEAPDENDKCVKDRRRHDDKAKPSKTPSRSERSKPSKHRQRTSPSSSESSQSRSSHSSDSDSGRARLRTPCILSNQEDGGDDEEAERRDIAEKASSSSEDEDEPSSSDIETIRERNIERNQKMVRSLSSTREIFERFGGKSSQKSGRAKDVRTAEKLSRANYQKARREKEMPASEKRQLRSFKSTQDSTSKSPPGTENHQSVSSVGRPTPRPILEVSLPARRPTTKPPSSMTLAPSVRSPSRTSDVSSVAARPLSTPDDIPKSIPDWVGEAEAYLRTVPPVGLWGQLVEEWLVFEARLEYPRCDQRNQWLPTKGRPPVIGKWVQERHVYDLNAVPCKLPSYATQWKIWYRNMQPEKRLPDNDNVWPLVVDGLPEQLDWSALERGGWNGFFMILMSLSWWMNACESQSDKDECASVIQDVLWVLGAIANSASADESSDRRTMHVHPASSASAPRSLRKQTGTSSSAPPSKRAKLA